MRWRLHANGAALTGGGVVASVAFARLVSSAHLAQVNIALAREPLDAPLLEEFMAQLAPVNARAEEL